MVKQSKTLIAALFLLTLWATALCAPAHADSISDPYPKVAKSYLVFVDGVAQWGHDIHKPLPPASLTKMMTSLLTMEHADLNDIVTVNKAAASETGSRIWIKEGDQLTVRDLLTATMVHSGNDACRALAEYIGGNEAQFVDMMNQRAKLLGMQDTHFMNACGHDHPEHYSTAADLAIVAQEVMRYPVINEIVSVVKGKLRTVDKKRVFAIKNRNELVGRYPGVIGVKTGYTKGAGKCLVAMAERGNHNVMLIMLNAPNRWWDAEEMLNQSFIEAGVLKTADATR